MEMILITPYIDAYEYCNVVVVDITGAFLATDMDKIVHMVLRGRIAELVAQVNPSIYWKYFRVENLHKVLYLQLKKYLYGTLLADLIFHKKAQKYMESQGFELNLYDPCAVESMVNNKQMMIVWYIDDLKILHVENN